jgi:hypothetical protein
VCFNLSCFIFLLVGQGALLTYITLKCVVVCFGLDSVLFTEGSTVVRVPDMRSGSIFGENYRGGRGGWVVYAAVNNTKKQIICSIYDSTNS